MMSNAQDIGCSGADDALPPGWMPIALKDIFVPQPKSKIKAGDAHPIGKYPFFNCSEKQTKFSDHDLVDGDNIFITTGGDFLFSHFHKGSASYSTDVWCVQVGKHFDASYVNHVLRNSHDDLQSYFRGFKFKHLDKKAFLKYRISCPSLASQRYISGQTQERILNAARVELVSGKSRAEYSEEGLNLVKSKPLAPVNGIKAEVPCEWMVSTIGARFRAVCGSTPSKDVDALWNGDIPWVTPADIGNSPGDLIMAGARSISELGAATMKKRMVPKGSVIVTTRASIGRTAIAGCDMYTNQGCHALIQDGDVIPEFIGHWLVVNADLLRSRSSGTTFLELPSTEFRDLEFAHPGLEEQRRICTVLNQLKGSVDATRSLLEVEARKFQWLRRQLLGGTIRIGELAAQE
jgi:hypothetical protein